MWKPVPVGIIEAEICEVIALTRLEFRQSFLQYFLFNNDPVVCTFFTNSKMDDDSGM